MDTEIACAYIQNLEYEVLQSTRARAISSCSCETSAGNYRVNGVSVYRVSGVGQGLGHKANKIYFWNKSYQEKLL